MSFVVILKALTGLIGLATIAVNTWYKRAMRRMAKQGRRRNDQVDITKRSDADGCLKDQKDK